MSTINGGHCYIQPLAWPLLYCIVPVVAILFAEGLVLLDKQLPMMDKMLVRQVFITVALCTTCSTVIPCVPLAAQLDTDSKRKKQHKYTLRHPGISNQPVYGGQNAGPMEMDLQVLL